MTHCDLKRRARCVRAHSSNSQPRRSGSVSCTCAVTPRSKAVSEDVRGGTQTRVTRVRGGCGK
eukprot:6213588-Pleurochrysis_carterae.AAC.6